jgi:hypothetical protein
MYVPYIYIYLYYIVYKMPIISCQPLLIEVFGKKRDVRLAGRAPGGGEVEGDGLLAALDITQGDGIAFGVDERGAEQVGQRLGGVGEVRPARVARDAVAALRGQQLGSRGGGGEENVCQKWWIEQIMRIGGVRADYHEGSWLGWKQVIRKMMHILSTGLPCFTNVYIYIYI